MPAFDVDVDAAVSDTETSLSDNESLFSDVDARSIPSDVTPALWGAPPSAPQGQEFAPYGQSSTPFSTSSVPFGTPSTPFETSTTPFETSSAPFDTSSGLFDAPSAPFETPSARYVQPSTPYGPPYAPYGQPSAPYELPVAPYGQPSASYVQPSAPYGQPAAPYGQPAAPFGPPYAPYGQPSAPYGEPAAPYGPPTAPYGPPAAPYGPPAAPYGPPAVPYGPPAVPYGPPAAPYGPLAAPYGQPYTPYGEPPAPYAQPMRYGQPPAPYGQAVIRSGPVIFPTEQPSASHGQAVIRSEPVVSPSYKPSLPHGQAVIRYGPTATPHTQQPPTVEEVLMKCIEPDASNMTALVRLQTADIRDMAEAIAYADAYMARQEEEGEEEYDWWRPSSKPWLPPPRLPLPFLPNGKTPFPHLPRVLRPVLEYDPAPRTRAECLALHDKIRGHQRAPSGSREFKELTKRDAQVQLQQELQKLLDTATDAHRALAQRQLDGFARLFERFLREEGPSVQWENIEKLPENAVRDYSTLNTPSVDIVHDMLGKLVVVKLNGGLGTSMGCHGPKSVIPVRSDLTFLDLTVQQIEHLNKTYKANVPLVLMDSFNTDEDTQKIIRKYKGLQVEIYTFNQSCYPRINRDSLLPVPRTCEVDDNMEAWYPPGHGDFYYSFQESGLLKRFLEDGRQYCFISNIDNLGATVDLNILDLLMNPMYGDATPEFVMEVTDKTRADVKGGTLIQYEGKLRLLEIAQVPKEHIDEFKSVKTFKFFNTNNLWAKLDAIERVLTDGTLNMEVIINNKALENGLNIIQLETAVGAAMKSFEGGLGINVPRSRFLPVKKTSDLLLVMSNLYNLQNGSLAMSPERMFPTTPFVKLGDNHFSKVKEFLARFANIPDLMELDHLTVSGDVTFGRGVILKGTVIIIANHGDRIDIPSGSVLENKIVSGNMRILDH